MSVGGRWRIGLLLVLLATTVRVVWALLVPTIPVGDFATYRESATYLAELGHFDSGFVYMPGLVSLLAAIRMLGGGGVTADKLLGAAFGGLAAGPLYFVTSRLLDNGRPGHPGQRDSTSGSGRVRARAPVALVAGLSYALWPAGIASASVIGTDIPTAALLLLALALLCLWGETRPVLAAVAFGAAMGLAAYFRAVALPLTILSAGYWLARRAGLRATVVRTAIAVGVTVLMLVPWGLRNHRKSGEFYLTDSHGGITLLMGNYPNTEGTYARSLGALFQDLTGRTFLMEPHRQTDRAAYALATQWISFDPLWTAGMIARRTERLLAPERGLLYWPVYRPGVLPRDATLWFNQYRRPITRLTDVFYLVFATAAAAGLAFSVAERRWGALVPLSFAMALAATYALFVAEPRYRLTTEVLLFPLAAFGLVRVGAIGARAVASVASSVRGKVGAGVGAGHGPGAASDPFTVSAIERRGLLGAVVAVLVLASGALVVVRGGAALRDRHRWAATVCRVDGQPSLAMWRPRADDGGGPSPVRGTPTGAVLALARDRPEVSAEIVLPRLVLPRGPVGVGASIAWQGEPAPGTRVAIGAASPVGGAKGTNATAGTGLFAGSFDHAGGQVRLIVRVEQPPDAHQAALALIENLTLSTTTPSAATTTPPTTTTTTSTSTSTTRPTTTKVPAP